MKKRLILAKFKEDVSNIISNCNDVEIVIYNKDNDLQNYDDFVIKDNSLIDLCNIGRESHTYLMHIVKNYDELYDIEIFSQAKPDDHMNINTFFSLVKNDENIINNGFVDFSELRKYFCWNFDEISTLQSKIYWTQHIGHVTDIQKNWHEEVYGPFDTRNEFLEFGAHGIFAVTKEFIRRHKKEVYMSLLEKFNPKLNSQEDIVEYGYQFEHFWKILFTHPNHWKPIN
jgi:hypothetical protein